METGRIVGEPNRGSGGIRNKAFNYLNSTGQTLSDRDGDDAWVNENVFFDITVGEMNPIDPSDFSKVLENNSFGNKELWTDINGKQVYADNYGINHHMGIGWFLLTQAVALWNSAIDDSLGTDFGGNNSQNGFTDWFMANRLQLEMVYNLSKNNPFDYPPFSDATIINLHTSTTDPGATGVSYALSADIEVDRITKSSVTREFLFCRRHF